jgi:aryl-alcohol dehydrogenase-like predicted oxidoreductase
MFKRKLGSTPEMLSVVGFGGILVMDETPAESSRIVAAAIERGINYFDVAPSYGNAEERLGPALEPYRSGVFLACKTGKRDAAGAEAELHASLGRMRTDHFDLYQLHAVTTDDDVQQILAPGGALETFVKARQQGLVRYLGFSAHSEKAALDLMAAFDFDTILFPLNWAIWQQNHFGPQVLSVANQKGMGILALKVLAHRAWGEGEERKWKKTWYAPLESAEEAALALRFTLSLPGADGQPAVTALTSPGHFHLFQWACDAADNFTPLSEAELEELKQRGQGLQLIFPQKGA